MRRSYVGEEERGAYVRLKPRIEYVTVPYVIDSSDEYDALRAHYAEHLYDTVEVHRKRYTFGEAVRAGIVKAEDYE